MSGSRFMEQASILVAKARAIRDEIKVALQANFHMIEVEWDNQIVIGAMKTHINTLWQITPILQDIRNMISNCESTSFTHIYREG